MSRWMNFFWMKPHFEMSKVKSDPRAFLFRMANLEGPGRWENQGGVIGEKPRDWDKFI